MYEPRYGYLLDWVCITGQHELRWNEGRSDGENYWANVAIVFIYWGLIA